MKVDFEGRLLIFTPNVIVRQDNKKNLEKIGFGIEYVFLTPEAGIVLGILLKVYIKHQLSPSVKYHVVVHDKISLFTLAEQFGTKESEGLIAGSTALGYFIAAVFCL